MILFFKKIRIFLIIIAVLISSKGIAFAGTSLYQHAKLNLYLAIPDNWRLQYENTDLQENAIKSTQIIAQFILPESETTFRNNINISIAPAQTNSFQTFIKSYPNEYQNNLQNFFPDYQNSNIKNFSGPPEKLFIEGTFSHNETTVTVFNWIIFEKNFFYSLKLACSQNDCSDYKNDFQYLNESFSHQSFAITENPAIKLKTPDNPEAAETPKTEPEVVKTPTPKTKVKRKQTEPPPIDLPDPPSSEVKPKPEPEPAPEIPQKIPEDDFKAAAPPQPLWQKLTSYLNNYRIYLGIGAIALLFLIIIKIVLKIIRVNVSQTVTPAFSPTPTPIPDFNPITSPAPPSPPPLPAPPQTNSIFRNPNPSSITNQVPLTIPPHSSPNPNLGQITASQTNPPLQTPTSNTKILDIQLSAKAAGTGNLSPMPPPSNPAPGQAPVPPTN